MSRKPSYMLRFTVLTLVAALLVTVVLFGASLVRGANTVREIGTIVKDEVAVMQGYLEKYDFARARLSAKGVARYADQMVEESSSLSWEIASELPYVGVDIKVARGLVAVADIMADEVAVPLTELIDQLANASVATGNAPLTFDNVESDTNNVGELIVALRRAKSATEEVDARLAELSSAGAHFQELNDAVAQIQSSVSTLKTTFEDAEPLVETASSAQALLAAIINRLSGVLDWIGMG